MFCVGEVGDVSVLFKMCAEVTESNIEPQNSVQSSGGKNPNGVKA